VRHNISTTTIQLPVAETPESGETRANVSAGHLSVHVQGAHAPDVPFLFEQQSKRLGPAFLTSFLLQVAAIALVLALSRYGVGMAGTPAVLPEEPTRDIIWLSQPGPGGGGGGGGNQMKEPPRQAQLPGKDKITVPVNKPPKLEPQQQANVEPTPIAQLNIPAKELAASTLELPGAIEVPPGPPTPSQGTGIGGGAGTGRGSGIGPGTGSGLGPGSGGGTGGGIYQPGNGVTIPIKVREVKPAYTSDAMRAKIQGTVWLQCVVRVDGSVTDVQVVKSLDPVFGLDQEAVKAARQWLFRPGTRLGQPVSVQITIEMEFTLR
jgi:protein TonB